MTEIEKPMSHAASNRKPARMVRIDDGRRLLSIATLAAGGAALALMLGGVFYAAVYRAQSPLHFDILVAALGGIIALGYLLKVSPIFFHHHDD